MLQFFSANNEKVNSSAAMEDCINRALDGQDKADCRLITFHTTMGHKYKELVSVAHEMCPNAEIVGCTGCGIIGKDGVSEKMRALGVMAAIGDKSDVSVSHLDGLTYENSYEVAKSAAEELKNMNPAVNMINVLASGRDIVADRFIEGVEDVFGGDIPIFGGTASDNVKAIKSYQSVGDRVMEHGLILIGFADPSLEVLMAVNHGNVAVDDPFEVTDSKDNRVLKLDGQPAWPAVMERVNMPADSSLQDALRILCFGVNLPRELREEYDNDQILYVPFRIDEAKQSFYMPVTIEPGTKLSIVQRDEPSIFGGLKRMMDGLLSRMNGRRPLAVFHTDCAARGRMTFNMIAKDEIIARMQDPLFDGKPVPWLGLYGFGEIALLGNKNRFHNQTSSLYVIVKKTKRKLDNLSFEELREEANKLQRKVNQFIVVRQDLIDTRDQLDSELARFRIIQKCNEEILATHNMKEFSEILLESFVEAFEFEASVFSIYNTDSRQLDTVQVFGLENPPETIPFDLDRGVEKKSLILDNDHPILCALGLGEAIMAPFFDNKDRFKGVILGGNTKENLSLYKPLREDIKTSFLVMVSQAGSLFSNYELKSQIREQNVQLKEYSKGLEKLVAERTRELRETNKDLEIANQFIKKTFGRYLSDDIVSAILESPDGRAIRGEKRIVTILMSDLRGFTTISEQHPAEDVVSIVNIYLGTMTEIIMKYNGTIDEFIGDSILAVFGAPAEYSDSPERAVACALEMQMAMEEVNRICTEKGHPRIAQGIGINTGEVVVGNIGSEKRTKYSTVGQNVNITARIESYTVGGQILISQSTRDACGDILKIESEKKIHPKGIKPMTVYEVSGIKGAYNTCLPEKIKTKLYKLKRPLSVQFSIVDGKNILNETYDGSIARLGNNVAELYTDQRCDTFTNIKLSLYDNEAKTITTDLFAKIVEVSSESPQAFLLFFTSVPGEAEQYLQRDF